MATSPVVPERLSLIPSVKNQNWNKISLIPLDIGNPDDDDAEVKEMEPISAKDVIKQNKGAIGSIAFVVRRPG